MSEIDNLKKSIELVGSIIRGKFKNYGYYMEKGETMQELALRITKTNPHGGHKALEFVRQYYLMEYGQSGQGRGLHPLLNQIRLMLKKKYPT